MNTDPCFICVHLWFAFGRGSTALCCLGLRGGSGAVFTTKTRRIDEVFRVVRAHFRPVGGNEEKMYWVHLRGSSFLRFSGSIPMRTASAKASDDCWVLPRAWSARLRMY